MDPFVNWEEQFEVESPSEALDKRLLAETMLRAFDLEDSLRANPDILPTSVQCQLAVDAQQFRSPHIPLPEDFAPLIDTDTIELAILTYVFDSPETRPYLEIRFEDSDTSFMTLSKPGVDINGSFNGSLVLSGHEYQEQIAPEEIADLVDQLVVPSLDNVPIFDPQAPGQARDIIDRLVESQQADLIENRVYSFVAPDDSEGVQQYLVRLSSVNGTPHEIEIESVLYDEISFDDKGEPCAEQLAMIATLSFDKSVGNFSQSVQFTVVENGKQPEDISTDDQHLKLLAKTIETILSMVSTGPDETFEATDLLS